MFERFTDRARRATVLAQEEARDLKHHYIGTEHILLGLIHEGEGIAAQSLESLGVSLEGVRGQVEEMIGHGQVPPAGHIPFTVRAKKVFELSLREALQLDHNCIGTEHLLLGLIHDGKQNEGNAVKILTKFGVDLTQIREVVIKNVAGYQTPQPTYVQQLLVRELNSVNKRIAELNSELQALNAAHADIQSYLSPHQQAESA